MRGGNPLGPLSLPNLNEGYAAVGSNWMSAEDFGAVDINGDGLGSDGFLFFGDFSGTPNDSQSFADRVELLPSYVSVVAASPDVVGVTSGFPEFGSIDNPSLSDGTDEIAGYIFRQDMGINALRDLFTFSINGLVDGQTVRVGVLGGVDGNDDGRFDPLRISIISPDGTMDIAGGLGANPGLANAGWVFFDVTQQGTYTVQASRRTSGGEGGLAVGGVTFDSIVDSNLGGIELLIANDPANPGNLFFSWESDPEFEYDLLSDIDFTDGVIGWPVYNDGSTLFENIPASGTGTTTLSNVARVGDRRFFVLQSRRLARTVVFSTDFENGDGGFSTSDDPAVWALGTPNNIEDGFGGDVRSANSGIDAWGTNLDGPIPPDTTATLSSSEIDLTGLSVSATLSFVENLDLQTGTSGEVWVVDNATGEDIGTAPIYIAIDESISTTGYMPVGPLEFPSDALGQVIRLEFRYMSDNAADFLGWYIDDVTVEGL